MVAQSSFDPGGFGPFGNFFEAYFNGLQAVSQSFGLGSSESQELGAQATAPIKTAARCQLEVMSFVNRRAQAQIEFPHRLARCRTPQDLLTEQVDFWRTAIEQFTESSQRIVEASSQLFNRGFDEAAEARRNHDYIAFSSSREAGDETRRNIGRERQRRVA